VFDPETVIDVATFEDSKQFPRGIEHVIVEGELMIMNGEHRSSGSGVVVRSERS